MMLALKDLIQALSAFAQSPPTLGDDERKELLAACESARFAAENPLDATVRLIFGAFDGVALRLAIDIGLIDHIVSAKSPITAEELSSLTGGDSDLIVRVMRTLVTMNAIDEVEKQTYVAKSLARIYVTGSPLREATIHVTSQAAAVAMLPEYLLQNGYQSPKNAYDGPYQFAYKTKDHFFDWLEKRPADQHAFNVSMAHQRMERGEEWFEFYPVLEKMNIKTTTGIEILMVDVGGSVGHDIINFQKRFPTLEGKLIFTDLPKLIESARDGLVGIQGVAHDFFTPLPPSLQNAKVYYLRNILHDWPDKEARKILDTVKSGMSSDSILLINENVMPDKDVAPYQAHLDLIMMAVFSALDRTVDQFQALLETSGYRLVNVWKPKDYIGGSGMLLEAVLRD